MDQETSFDRLIGLHVTDDAGYDRYRAGMTPILQRYGGKFRQDFRIGEVLRSETPDTINRLFVLSFPSREVSERFFADPAYLDVRSTFFDPSVAAVAMLAEYERPA